MKKGNEIEGIVKARQELMLLLSEAADATLKSAKLPPMALPETALERPQNSEHGDYASSYPLKLARVLRLNPLDIARSLMTEIKEISDFAEVEVAPPGFINFTLKNSWLTGQVNLILNSGENFGNTDVGKSTKVQLEFVSANPTGPLACR